MDTTLQKIKINGIDGQPIDWSGFEGKKILIVNVASECGFTSQYVQMQELHMHHGDKVVVLGVPCNDFGGQEPGTESEIIAFCSKEYKVTFPMTQKVGILNDTHPLYQWLTKGDLNGYGDSEVKWNFHKYLINSDGSIHNEVPSSVSPIDESILTWVKS